MDDKKYNIILLVIFFFGVLSTLVLLGYTAYLHDHCSIISYIANEPF